MKNFWDSGVKGGQANFESEGQGNQGYRKSVRYLLNISLTSKSGIGETGK